MKTKTTIIAALLALMPAATFAQKNIQKAFDALIKSNDAEISQQHSLDKDVETGKKRSQSDIYDFIIPKDKKTLVKDIESAFDRDRDRAYSVRSSTNSNKIYTALAVGNGTNGGVRIGTLKGSSYIYACFLDPGDAEKKYRYAYALEWKENGNTITGKLVTTYATTQQYRQGKQRTKTTVKVNGQTVSADEAALLIASGDAEADSVSWMAQFSTYKNLCKKSSKTARVAYVGLLYKLCKTPPQLTGSEKKMAIEELEALKKDTDDSLVSVLLDRSIEHLKK